MQVLPAADGVALAPAAMLMTVVAPVVPPTSAWQRMASTYCCCRDCPLQVLVKAPEVGTKFGAVNVVMAKVSEKLTPCPTVVRLASDRVTSDTLELISMAEPTVCRASSMTVVRAAWLWMERAPVAFFRAEKFIVVSNGSADVIVIEIV